MTSIHSFRLSGIVVAMVIAMPLQAQTLYRCGKSFQDRPCDTGTQGKVVSVSAQMQTQASSAVDMGCVARGDRAKRIMWAREVGKTKEDQIASSTSARDRNLINEVYQMRGTSNDVGAAIETKCVADKERAAQAAAAVLALQPEQGTSANAQPLAVEQAAPVKPASDQVVANAASKKQRCDSLNSQLQDIKNSERGGGSASAMDSMRSRRRAVEAQLQGEGC